MPTRTQKLIEQLHLGRNARGVHKSSFPKAVRLTKKQETPDDPTQSKWSRAWVVALTKSNRDRAFADECQSQRLTRLIFLAPVQLQPSRNRKTTQPVQGQVPIFPGYAFVYGRLNLIVPRIRQSKHCFDLIVPKDQRLVEQDLERLLKITTRQPNNPGHQDLLLQFQGLCQLKPGVHVEILNTHLAGTQGTITEIDEDNRFAKIQFPFIDNQCAVYRIDLTNVRLREV